MLRALLTCLLFVPLGCSRSLESKSAGSVGCRASDIVISDVSKEGGYSQSVTSWMAECAGRRFICSEVAGQSGHGADVNCTETLASQQEHRGITQPQPQSVPDSAPPLGAAGFTFGDDVETVKNACEAAGHQWSQLAEGRFRCSGAAQDVGFAAVTVLEFCRRVVCGVTLVYSPTSGWVDSIAELKGSLESKYGEVREKQVVAGPTCSGDGAFTECVEGGRVRIRYTWKWPSRERIDLRVATPEPDYDGVTEAAIRIVYVKPNARIRPNASAL